MVALAQMNAEIHHECGEQGANASQHLAPYGYQGIIFFADVLDDLERVRIANENRLRTLTRTDEWGKAAPAHMVKGMEWQIQQFRQAEAAAELALKREVRMSPLAVYVQDEASKGVGEKGLGRLVKETGNPTWNYKHDRPRQLRELYAYCGLHVVAGEAPRLRKGQKPNWSTEARKRLYVIADSVVKAGVRKLEGVDDSEGYDLEHREPVSRLGGIYLDARRRYADSTHQVECIRCGPSGTPAQVGTPLNPGHQHARGLRIVMKTVLRDIFEAAGGVIPISEASIARPEAIDSAEAR
jgi:hypothetical protein